MTKIARIPEVDDLTASFKKDLASYACEWRTDVASLCGDAGDEVSLTRIASLAHRTRALARVVDVPMAVACALLLEAMLTLHLSGRVSFESGIGEAVRESGSCMERVLETMRRKGTVEDSRTLRSDLFRCVGTLAAELKDAFAATSTEPCMPFPVLREDEPEQPSLQIYGFDVWRVTQEALHVYVLEFAIEELLERGSGIGALAASLSRSGYVFDMQTFPDESISGRSGGVLRVVFSGPFEQTFVEALARVASHCVHPVNIDKVRQGTASWKGNPGPVVSARPQRATDLDTLLAAYDASMDKLFEASRSPQPAPPEEDPLLAAFEAALAQQKTSES